MLHGKLADMSGKVETTLRARAPLLVDIVTWPPFIVLALLYGPNTRHADYTTLPGPASAAVWSGALLLLILSYVAHMMHRDQLAMRVVYVIAVLAVLSTINKATSLVRVLHLGQGIDGWALLENGVTVWLDNVLIFSLVYWATDRGGPAARRVNAEPADWLFPEMTLNGKRTPNYIDYFCLAFNTATAFGPTDVMTLSTRARSLMVVESAISLATFAIVGARAVGILS